MAKNFQPKGKQSRRDGIAVHPKGVKVLSRRAYIPGQHGPESRGKLTEYGKQLREKQKAKHLYGILERQFSKYFEAAQKKEGNTGLLLMQFLETRLDNAVYRAGLAKTRPQARQAVSHGHILVNGKKVNVPSYVVKIGDVLSLKPQIQKSPLYFSFSETKSQAPGWLAVNSAEFSAKVISLPSSEEIEKVVDPRLIVEFYSR